MTDSAPDLSRRAQLLATEHWSLLASRSTTQSEVLVRIQMFLTLVSAGLVSLALVGQATGFRTPFPGIAVGVLAFVVLAGTLTTARVHNVAMEDLMHVLAMNRLRAAYLDLDPGVAPYLMMSAHDDFAGARRTYYSLGPRGSLAQVAAGSEVFLVALVSVLAGMLGASVGGLLAAPAGVVVAIGVPCAALYFAAWIWLGLRALRTGLAGYTPLKPSVPASA